MLKKTHTLLIYFYVIYTPHEYFLYGYKIQYASCVYTMNIYTSSFQQPYINAQGYSKERKERSKGREMKERYDRGKPPCPSRPVLKLEQRRAAGRAS